MDFGKVSLEFRAKHSLTQVQMAEILGVTNGMICNYEKGRFKPSKMKAIRFNYKMKEWEENKNGGSLEKNS